MFCLGVYFSVKHQIWIYLARRYVSLPSKKEQQSTTIIRLIQFNGPSLHYFLRHSLPSTALFSEAASSSSASLTDVKPSEKWKLDCYSRPAMVTERNYWKFSSLTPTAPSASAKPSPPTEFMEDGNIEGDNIGVGRLCPVDDTLPTRYGA